MGDKRKLLVVDSKEGARESIRYIVKPRFDVLMASDGEEGFEVARRHNPDAIFTDANMPQPDGIGMSVRLRDEPGYKGKICLMSSDIYLSGAPDLAHAGDTLREGIRRHGIDYSMVDRYFDAFLPKLFSVKDFCSILNSFCLRVQPQ